MLDTQHTEQLIHHCFGISVFSSESNDESTGSDEEEEGEQMAPTLPDGTSVFSSEN